MAYPTSDTTYKLPFGDKIRVSSKRRFILVRHLKGADTKPFIVLRSDDVDKLSKPMDRSTDFIIDQAEGTVVFEFGDHWELHNALVKAGDSSKFIRLVDPRSLSTAVNPDQFTARTLHGKVTL